MTSERSIDLDRLASYLQGKVDKEKLTLRAAAEQIGCSAATLSRILKGEDAPTYPDSRNLFRAISWLGKSISDFEEGAPPSETTISDIEVHLRALKGLTKNDQEALVAMVKAAYEAASELRSKKGEGG